VKNSNKPIFYYLIAGITKVRVEISVSLYCGWLFVENNTVLITNWLKNYYVA
jgi:hypothetical protein